MELQSEMADARKKHEVNIKFHDSISCNIYAVTTYLPSNQYTGGPPLMLFLGLGKTLVKTNLHYNDMIAFILAYRNIAIEYEMQ